MLFLYSEYNLIMFVFIIFNVVVYLNNFKAYRLTTNISHNYSWSVRISPQKHSDDGGEGGILTTIDTAEISHDLIQKPLFRSLHLKQIPEIFPHFPIFSFPTFMSFFRMKFRKKFLIVCLHYWWEFSWIYHFPLDKLLFIADEEVWEIYGEIRNGNRIRIRIHIRIFIIRLSSVMNSATKVSLCGFFCCYFHFFRWLFSEWRTDLFTSGKSLLASFTVVHSSGNREPKTQWLETSRNV